MLSFSCSQLERVFPKQIRPPVPLGKSAEAIRTAGSDAENCLWQLATSVALLIELEAQFYKLVTINQCHAAYTCEMVNKSSKSNLCYIDSDPIVIDAYCGAQVQIRFMLTSSQFQVVCPRACHFFY